MRQPVPKGTKICDQSGIRGKKRSELKLKDTNQNENK